MSHCPDFRTIRVNWLVFQQESPLTVPVVVTIWFPFNLANIVFGSLLLDLNFLLELFVRCGDRGATGILSRVIGILDVGDSDEEDDAEEDVEATDSWGFCCWEFGANDVIP